MSIESERHHPLEAQINVEHVSIHFRVPMPMGVHRFFLGNELNVRLDRLRAIQRDLMRGRALFCPGCPAEVLLWPKPVPVMSPTGM